MTDAVNRWTIYEDEDGCLTEEKYEKGKYVLYSDYAKLEAVHERMFKRYHELGNYAAARINTLCDEKGKLEAEVARLKSVTWCAYCGKEYPLDTVTAEQVSEHIHTCPKHPLAALEQENAKLEAENQHNAQQLLDALLENAKLREVIQQIYDTTTDTKLKSTLVQFLSEQQYGS